MRTRTEQVTQETMSSRGLTWWRMLSSDTYSRDHIRTYVSKNHLQKHWCTISGLSLSCSGCKILATKIPVWLCVCVCVSHEMAKLAIPPNLLCLWNLSSFQRDFWQKLLSSFNPSWAFEHNSSICDWCLISSFLKIDLIFIPALPGSRFITHANYYWDTFTFTHFMQNKTCYIHPCLIFLHVFVS